MFVAAVAAWVLCYSLVEGTARDVFGWAVFGVVLLTAPIGRAFWTIRGSVLLRRAALVVGAGLLVVSVLIVDDGAWSPVLGWVGAFLLISVMPDENLALRRADDTA